MKKIFISIFLCFFLITSVFCQLLITPAYVDSVAMRDGKKIAVDIYIPDNGTGNAYPVILVQTPYNRLLYRAAGLPLFGNSIADDNYAMVIADWRCFYGSAAACSGNYDRAKDGYDLVEWIATQPWSNGKIGTWGPSALGRIQFMTARKRPPHLTCAVPLVAGPQYSYPEYYPGGVLRTEYVEQLDALGFGSSPMILAHQVHDIVWTYSEMTNYYPDSINVPMLMIGGWYDHNINMMMEFFAGIRQSSDIIARDKHRLLMGPWTHGGHGNAGIGAPQQGELTYLNAVGWSDSLALMHFDYYMRSIANNWNTSPYIQYYQMGENTWQSCVSWPPAGMSNHNLYFQEDGSISQTMPQNADVYKQIVYDPRNPSPTIGGATLRADLEQGPYDQAPQVESKNDILVFTSAVLLQNVVLKGKSTIHLFVSSDRKDTDFAVRLTDVYPDNSSMLLYDGIARMRFRNGFNASDTSCMTPGQIYEIEINLPDQAITFLSDHRIRVDISSSDYPRFDCNLNNGGAMYAAGDTLIATNKVYVASNYASHIVMPLNGFFVNVAENYPQNKHQIKVFPNPAAQEVNIQFDKIPEDATEIILFDNNGKKVLSKICTPSLEMINVLNIPLQGMAEGVYTMHISGRNINFSEKIIIKK